jgi:D-lactate dehydrogenase
MSPQHTAFLAALRPHVAAERLITDPTRTLAYGTDASFYRLLPQIVVCAIDEREVSVVLRLAQAHGVAVTLRAAGTSLSGQAVSDSVLVIIQEGWTGIEVLDGGARIRLQPGVIGQHANDALRRYGRKIGPDPASIATARIGGIAANNSSGMCCGTAQNGYHTLAALRVMLGDGTLLDTADAPSVVAFRSGHADLLAGLEALSLRIRSNPALEAKVRRKYRLKNTTGYGINALIDFIDPVDMLAHLMIGSEGTLGFISSITYHTVLDHPHKASALVLFDELEAACQAVSTLKAQGAVDAVELVDQPSILAVQGKAGLPDFLYGVTTADTPRAAALLIETRGASADELATHCEQINTTLAAHNPAAHSGFSSDAAVCETYWAVRKGLFPAVGATRPVGTTCVIEDVAFPVERLAEGVLRLRALLQQHGYTEALIFGHALDGNLHFVFAPGFDSEAEVQRYSRFMDDVGQLVAVEFGGSLKAEHGTGRNVAPFVRLEWGDEAYEVMLAIKQLFDPAGLLNPDVIISRDEQIHLKDLKRLPAADDLVDKCIECGFCEPVCPSNGLSLTPRQRIVLWRRIQQLQRDGSDPTLLAELQQQYGWLGLDTCAATGMCATRCPVGINTGAAGEEAARPGQPTRPGADAGAAPGQRGGQRPCRPGGAETRPGCAGGRPGACPEQRHAPGHSAGAGGPAGHTRPGGQAACGQPGAGRRTAGLLRQLRQPRLCREPRRRRHPGRRRLPPAAQGRLGADAAAACGHPLLRAAFREQGRQRGGHGGPAPHGGGAAAGQRQRPHPRLPGQRTLCAAADRGTACRPAGCPAEAARCGELPQRPGGAAAQADPER